MKRPDVNDYDMQAYGYISALTAYVNNLEKLINSNVETVTIERGMLVWFNDDIHEV